MPEGVRGLFVGADVIHSPFWFRHFHPPMLYDAHNHLQDERLAPWRQEIIASMPEAGLAEMVVNGTREEDWPQVAELARRHPWIRPAFGLHPWHVKKRSPDWLDSLRAQLAAHPGAVIGEVGLDRWMEDPDIDAQLACFRAQMALAVEFDRPVTIHCLRAFGLLDEALRSIPLPGRGFLLHSYGGPAEMVAGFAALGGYFSISPYFAHPRKAAQRAVFSQIPHDRLLAETDAPDMWPPDDDNLHLLTAKDGCRLNHPVNLRVSYRLLSELLKIETSALETLIADNHRTLFGVT